MSEMYSSSRRFVVAETSAVDDLLDRPGPNPGAGSWHEHYADGPDLDTFGLLNPGDLSQFVDAAVGTVLRLDAPLQHLRLEIVEGPGLQQRCYVLVQLSQQLLIASASFALDALLPGDSGSLTANAGAVLAAVAERANAVIAGLGDFLLFGDAARIRDRSLEDHGLGSPDE